MLANEIYNFMTSNKLIESIFIMLISIVLLIFIVRNIIIIISIVLLITIILFVLNYIPLWLFTLIVILISGEIYNKTIKRGD